jgi:hypothetical protein
VTTGDEVVGDRDAGGDAATGTEAGSDTTGEPDETDVVAIGAPGGGPSLTGVAVGGTLAVGLAGAAVVRSRRRESDPGPEL